MVGGLGVDGGRGEADHLLSGQGRRRTRGPLRGTARRVGRVLKKKSFCYFVSFYY